MENTGTPRRTVLNWFLGTTFGGLFASVVYPIVRYVSPPHMPEATTNQVEAGSESDPELQEKGFKIVQFGADPVILVKVGDTDYRAYSATCTHLDCIVEYQKEKSRMWCNCHNGEYDLNGRNVGGPPPKPLSPYVVNRVVGKPGAPATLVVSRS